MCTPDCVFRRVNAYWQITHQNYHKHYDDSLDIDGGYRNYICRGNGPIYISKDG